MILVLFDVDGTLVYSDKRDSRSFAQTYKQVYGRAFPSIDWSTFPHVTDDTIFRTAIRRQFEREVEVGEMATFQEQYLQRLHQNRRQAPQHYREIPGARRMMEQLYATAGFQVAVATGGWAAPARIKLRHVGIDPDGMVLTGGDAKTTREEILQQSIDQVQGTFPVEKVVYVGDAIWDVRTTRKMGLQFVGVRYRNDREVLQQAGARHVIQDFGDYHHFLEQVAQAAVPMEESQTSTRE